jgi:hypothetical protein
MRELFLTSPKIVKPPNQKLKLLFVYSVLVDVKAVYPLTVGLAAGADLGEGVLWCTGTPPTPPKESKVPFLS